MLTRPTPPPSTPPSSTVAFGEILAESGNTDDFLRRFNGKEQSQLSDLSYYGYRYFDPFSLTWTQADPLYRFAPDLAYDQPRRMNLYSFSLNNPLRYVDPDGKNPAICLEDPELCIAGAEETAVVIEDAAVSAKDHLYYGLVALGTAIGDVVRPAPSPAPTINDDASLPHTKPDVRYAPHEPPKPLEMGKGERRRARKNPNPNKPKSKDLDSGKRKNDGGPRSGKDKAKRLKERRRAPPPESPNPPTEPAPEQPPTPPKDKDPSTGGEIVDLD